MVTCWSEAGVYGNGSCPELKEHVHCHHCPVFSAAGLQLLNRPLSLEYRAERTRQFSMEKEVRDANTTSAVLFRIRTEWLGLPTSFLQEVTERKAIHSLPHRRRGFVLGLANIRGELLVCISLTHLLGMENSLSREEVRRSHGRILVVQSEGVRSAFPVDEVHGPYRLEPPLLRPLSSGWASSHRAYTQQILSWQNRVVGLLDSEFLFSTLNQSFT